MSAAEEADLLVRWRRLKDQKARRRVIEANLGLVPPIATAQARKFKLDQASPNNANRIKSGGLRVQARSCFRDLIGEGNLALVKAFDAFPEGANVRFEHYARPCIRNAVIRHAVSLLSVVDRPWGVKVKNDFGIDPAKPEPIHVDKSTGCRRAKPTSGAKENSMRSNFTELRSIKEDMRLRTFDELQELPWILRARLAGFKLREIAHRLNCSIPTAHRRMKAAIEEVRLNA
jgi:RNA polymerase sigma factor (sigma-70 family)